MLPILVPALISMLPVQPNGGMVIIKNQRWIAEIALTERERARTLAFRTLFKGERCMFVLPPEAGRHPVETIRFQIPFDAVWLDAEGNIVELAERMAPCKDGKGCPEYGGKEVSRYHILFQTGTIRQLNLKVGDQVRWDLHFEGGTKLRNGAPIPESTLPSGYAKGKKGKKK
jgi:uncharacterized membrane protein (UPF0127 family)